MKLCGLHLCRYKDDHFPTSALLETKSSILKDLESGELAYFYRYNELRVGMVRCLERENYFYFRRLSVLPSYQGRGIAKKILSFLEKEALRRNYRYIRCKVRQSEKKNIYLYQSIGYTIIDQEDIEKENGALPVVVMEKKIG